jgi:hypothetical protein
VTAINDVFDEEHVAPDDIYLQVHHDAHHPGGLAGARPIAGNCHKVNRVRHGDLAHQIGQKQHTALEDADQQQVLARIVGADLGAQLGDTLLQLLSRDEDLA